MPSNFLSSGVSVSNASDDKDIAESFYELFKNLLCSSLGESVGEAVLILVKKSLQQDLTKAFWENPKKVYDELFKIFGEGTKVLINIIVSGINQECGLDIKAELFVELIRREDRNAKETIHSIMKLVAKSYKKQ